MKIANILDATLDAIELFVRWFVSWAVLFAIVGGIVTIFLIQFDAQGLQSPLIGKIAISIYGVICLVALYDFVLRFRGKSNLFVTMQKWWHAAAESRPGKAMTAVLDATEGLVASAIGLVTSLVGGLLFILLFCV